MGELIHEDKRHMRHFLSPLPPVPIGKLVFWFCPMAVCLPWSHVSQHIGRFPPVDLPLEEQFVAVLCFWDQPNFVNLTGLYATMFKLLDCLPYIGIDGSLIG